MFDEYQHLAHSLFEGFTGIKTEIKGWSADNPQTLEVDLDLDPFVFLQELDGSTLGQSDEQAYQLDTLTLLSVAGQSWTFRGEFNSRKVAADLFYVADDSCWHPDNFTSLQRTAFNDVCRFLDALYEGLCEDWDSIGEAVYKVNESEVIPCPRH